METATMPSTVQRISTLLSTLDKDSTRYIILDTALQFKTNWIQLGEHLHSVDKSGEYKQWGYSTFDKYCSQEIGIRKKTVEKLTTSYYFLKNHSPQALEDKAKTSLPDLNTINTLAQTKADERISDEEYEGFKASVFEEGCTDRALKKQYNELIKTQEQSTFDDMSEQEESEKELSKQDIMNLIKIFEKIDRDLSELTGIPIDIPTDFRKILIRLKSLS